MKPCLLPPQVLYLINTLYNTVLRLFMLLITGSAFAIGAGDDPFPSLQLQNGDVINAVGTKMEISMKYAMVGGGVIMMLMSIGVIMHRLREDSINRDTGSFLTTLIIAGLAITFGIILIAIGWGAASYQPQS